RPALDGRPGTRAARARGRAEARRRRGAPRGRALALRAPPRRRRARGVRRIPRRAIPELLRPGGERADRAADRRAPGDPRRALELQELHRSPARTVTRTVLTLVAVCGGLGGSQWREGRGGPRGSRRGWSGSRTFTCTARGRRFAPSRSRYMSSTRARRCRAWPTSTWARKAWRSADGRPCAAA